MSVYSVMSEVYFKNYYNTFLCLHLVVDRMASVGAMVWTGLNHIKDGHGWGWSDGAPLSLVNFTTGTDYWFIQDQVKGKFKKYPTFSLMRILEMPLQQRQKRSHFIMKIKHKRLIL